MKTNDGEGPHERIVEITYHVPRGTFKTALMMTLGLEDKKGFCHSPKNQPLIYPKTKQAQEEKTEERGKLIERDPMHPFVPGVQKYQRNSYPNSCAPTLASPLPTLPP
jgi:hypothetical protein